jgi:uncharacterized membrane protein YqiK
MSVVLADGFQTGAILSVVLLLVILLAVLLWWFTSLRRGARR